jgi:hypothetical protein
VDEIVQLADADPCSIDSSAIGARLEARIPPLSRKLAGDFLPSTHNAFSRAASTEVAIEGTAKVATLKARREASASGSWPAGADDLRGSRCRNSQWSYERAADGSVRLSFDGKVDRPAGFHGLWVPLEYRAGP